MAPGPSGGTQSPGRRERNKQRVKERLYSSALSLFTEQGYDRTSVDEIAERADVARGTFFNYFQRKEDVISAWGEERRTKLLTYLEQEDVHGSHAVAQLVRCMSVLARINEEEQEVTAAMLSAWVKAGRPLSEEPYVAEIFADIVASGARSGELAPDLVPERIGNLLRDVYFGALYRWSQHAHNERPGELDDELQAVLKVLLHGIATVEHAHHV